MQKGISSIRKNGFKRTCYKVLRYCIQRNKMQLQDGITGQDDNQNMDTLPLHDVKFSILVPLYNTSEIFLQEMIESVQKQTYENWELCLADGSDDAHNYVEIICRTCSQKDPRIKYQKLERNLGISGNSNVALQIAEGNYIALFDHDDLLHPDALMEVAKRIEKQNADFIYTDEAIFITNLDHIVSVHRKPDYAPDNLRANNYICHFTVFSKKLLEKTEAFRSEYDGSQDHDLILRLTGIAENIVHIPKVLYFWRSHSESVASGIGAKSYAVKAGKNAVRDYLNNIEQPCTIESLSFCPTIYRIKYELIQFPLIAILLKVDTIKDIEHYIQNVISKNNYSNSKYFFLCTKKEVVMKAKKRLGDVCNYQIFVFEEGINYAKYINSIILNEIKCDYIVLMEQDLLPLSEEWLKELMMYIQRSDVGLVGSKVYYRNEVIKSAAVAIEENGNKVQFLYKYYNKEEQGYMGKLWYAQNVDAVTSDCIIFKKDCFSSVNGFETFYLTEQYMVIDLCVKLSKKNMLIVWNPYVEFWKVGSLRNNSIVDRVSRKTKMLNDYKVFTTLYKFESGQYGKY